MSKQLKVPKLVKGRYLGLEGTLGVCLLIISAAPQQASQLATVFPVMKAAGTLTLISYGILKGRRWGWKGGIIAMSVFGLTAALVHLDRGNGFPYLPLAVYLFSDRC